MVPNVTCLYPCKGNCHSFVASPRRAAVLDVLFPLYDEGNNRECTYYKSRASEEEDDSDYNCGDGGRRTRPLLRSRPSISQMTSIAWADHSAALVWIKGMIVFR
jgi:hypothetical protein